MAEQQDRLKIDELAMTAGVASTTIRLYQSKGLLPGPEVVGRVGFYDERHLARLRVIARLQDDGFSLAGIAKLLETWESGRDLGDIFGVERELDAILSPQVAVRMTAPELLDHFPPGALDAADVQRAISLGLVEPTDHGDFRIPDERFVHTGAALAHLGVPASIILDEWEHLSGVMAKVAVRFVGVFEDHLLPEGWRDHLDPAATTELARTLAELRAAADVIVTAALDDAVARLASKRLAELLPDAARA